LPIGLKSGSVSVPPKGCFFAHGEDLQSTDLLRHLKLGNIELIEETVVVEIPDDDVEPVGKDAPAEEKEEPTIHDDQVIEEVKEEPKDDNRDDVELENNSDILTSSLEMVESYNKDVDSKSDSTVKRKLKIKKKASSKKAKKKGVTG